MRNNGPVTQREYLIPDDLPLVSTTDLKSRITYCNPAFIAASGFTRDELIGQPHNLIRHQDMPAEAFRDMWATLESGRPWTALVKNRRKDGDHYWVRANVTPVLDGGSISGYMSVRTKPSRDEVAQAESLYASMREEAAAGTLRTTLQAGRLMPTGWRGMLRRAADRAPSLTRDAVVVAAVALAVGVGAAWPAGGLAFVAGVGLLIGLPLAWWTAHGASAPLRKVATVAERMAAGDLTGQLDAAHDDAFGRVARGLNQLNVNLRAVVGDVRREVEGVHLACAEISAAGRDLGQRTEAQSSNLQQAAAALEEIAANVRHTADGARDASRLGESTTAAARRTGQTSQAAGEHMDGVRKASDRIAEIVGVMEGISFRTNLLALNAAVEAARAGESGRGFAVVAGEVRALAQQASTSAREIKTLVEDTRDRVDQGVRIVNDTGRSAGEAEQAVAEMNALIARIGAAVVEQSAGVGDINSSVAGIDSLTQHNAALVEQLSASAASLAAQAETVVQAVRIFRVGSEATVRS